MPGRAIEGGPQQGCCGPGPMEGFMPTLDSPTWWPVRAPSNKTNRELRNLSYYLKTLIS